MSGAKLGAGQAASLDPALTYLFATYCFGGIFYFWLPEVSAGQAPVRRERQTGRKTEYILLRGTSPQQRCPRLRRNSQAPTLIF